MAGDAQPTLAGPPSGGRRLVPRDLRAAYARETAALVRQRLDLSLALYAGFMGIVVLFERRIPGHEEAVWAYGVELLICVLGLALPRVRRLARFTNGTAALVASALALVMLAYSAWVESQADLVALGQVCVVTCLAVILPWGWRAQLVLAGISLAGFATVLPYLEAQSPAVFSLVGVLTGATASCAAAFFLERYRFQDFVRAAELSHAYALQQEEADVSRTLLHVAETLSRFIGGAGLLERVNRLMTEALGCEFSSTFVYEEERRVFHFVGNVGLPSEVRTELEQIDFPPDSMPIFAKLERGELVEIADWARQELVPPELLRRFGLASLLCVPIHRNEQLVGVISTGYRTRTGPFSRKQRRLALGIGHAVALGLDNERLVRDLRAANRLKSDFVSTMSHELRTPLNVILGYAEMLSEETLAGEEDVRDLALRIRRSASELLELVNATLDLGRMEAGRDAVRLEPVELDELLAEAEAEFEPLARRAGLAVHWRNDLRGALLVTDRVKLKTILKNLVGNAIKYTPEGSVTIAVARDADGIVLAVRDTGVGIEPQDYPAIFEMFRQLDGSPKRVFGGVGLGLYIVRQLVDRLRGSIEVTSSPGAGSTFTVRLPELALPAAEAETLAARPAASRLAGAASLS